MAKAIQSELRHADRMRLIGLNSLLNLAENRARELQEIEDLNVFKVHKILCDEQIMLREAYRLFSGIAVAGDIQSPSFSNSASTESTRLPGVVTDRMHDYKRSRHLDAHHIEQQLGKYFGNSSALLCSSGMGALTTVLSWLGLDVLKGDQKCLIGDNSYYETKFLAQAILREKYALIDDTTTDSIIHQVHDHRPAALVLDTISTNLSLNAIDVCAVIETLSLEYNHPLVLIVDNTCGIDPKPLLDRKLPENLALIVVESMAKYSQLGLDVVAGGVIWSKAEKAISARLDRVREYTGTNISDSSILAIPLLAAARINELEKFWALRSVRLHRQEHNAISLSWLLQQAARGIQRVNYPKSVDGTAWNFRGTLINAVPCWPINSLNGARKWIDQALQHAKKTDLALIGGASFGFDITRLYPSNLDTQANSFYLRIACGTEPSGIMQKIGETLLHSLNKTLVLGEVCI